MDNEKDEMTLVQMMMKVLLKPKILHQMMNQRKKTKLKILRKLPKKLRQLKLRKLPKKLRQLKLKKKLKILRLRKWMWIKQK